MVFSPEPTLFVRELSRTTAARSPEGLGPGGLATDSRSIKSPAGIAVGVAIEPGP